MEKKEPKIILWDLETLPILPKVLKYITGLSNYPGLTMKANINSIICFGFKELRDKTAKVISAWDFKEWKKDVNDDKRICEIAYETLHDADAIVTQNGRKFDLPFLQTRLKLNKLPLLPKNIPHIDTRIIARSNFFLTSNSLNTMGEEFVNERKFEHEGWLMWEKVHARDEAACKVMAKYNKQDVLLLEKLYHEFLPLIQNLPNYGHFKADRFCCLGCGGYDMIKHGKRAKGAAVLQMWMCKDCGTYSYEKIQTKAMTMKRA